MNDVKIICADMPVTVKGQVLPTPDGNYYVFLNAHYNNEQQKEIYNHEMRHILKNHHYIEGNIAEIELEAADKALLCEEIKLAEEQGLPLINAVLVAKSDCDNVPSKPPVSRNLRYAGFEGYKYVPVYTTSAGPEASKEKLDEMAVHFAEYLNKQRKAKKRA